MFKLLNRRAARALAAPGRRGFAGMDFKRKPTKKDLDHYDLLVVGANAGGILSRHFDQLAHGKYKIMAIFENQINQQYPCRVIYEQQRASKNDYLMNSKLAINMYFNTYYLSIYLSIYYFIYYIKYLINYISIIAYLLFIYYIRYFKF